MTERWRPALDDHLARATSPQTPSRRNYGRLLQLDTGLSKRQISVHISSSSAKPINYGVPQGSLLGPRLYSIYVNDLPDAVTEGEVDMYADDTTAYCIGDNFDIVTQRLNLIFKQIYRWSLTLDS